MSNFKRTLGESGIEVSAMGFGCWAIGGHFWLDGKADGYGSIDDQESIKAIHRAYELGVTFFDTADAYGAGHSEKILGKALKGIRDKVVIATKFGYEYDEETKQVGGLNSNPEYIRQACYKSLRRLDTDYIDLYQIHIWSLQVNEAETAINTLENLKKEGLIRTYGWSTDHIESARLIARKPSCSAIQHNFNVFLGSEELINLCESNNLASINRSPLAMGFLSGKFDSMSKLPENDVRGAGHEWVEYFKNGRPKEEFLEKLSAVREILQNGGRSLVQGSLAYIWGKSANTIPIPGFRTVEQAEENAGSIEYGPLKASEIYEIDNILGKTHKLNKNS